MAAKPKTYQSDAGYIASISALDEARKQFNLRSNAELGRYDIDYKTGMRDLGYRDENINDKKPGVWDWNDVLTASGRGFQGNANDYSGRGMLQSSGYEKAQKDLGRSLEDQLGSMTQARTGYRAQSKEASAQYGAQDTAARNLARVSAIDRIANQLALY